MRSTEVGYCARCNHDNEAHVDGYCTATVYAYSGSMVDYVYPCRCEAPPTKGFADDLIKDLLRLADEKRDPAFTVTARAITSVISMVEEIEKDIDTITATLWPTMRETS